VCKGSEACAGGLDPIEHLTQRCRGLCRARGRGRGRSRSRGVGVRLGVGIPWGRFPVGVGLPIGVNVRVRRGRVHLGDAADEGIDRDVEQLGRGDACVGLGLGLGLGLD